MRIPSPRHRCGNAIAAAIRRLAVAMLFLAVAAAAPASAWAERFGAGHFTLDNGMQVVVIPNHRVAAVTHMVWYKVGAADDPYGRSGLAHFLEHLMFKGTKDAPPGTFTRLVAQNGGRENAFTTQDYTAFYQTVAADRLEMVMKFEADRMTNLVLTDDVVLPERDVIIEERHMRIDNEPSALFNEQFRASLFLHHPYRIPTIGWEHEMRQLSTEDALAFYHRWYAPNNAVLVIAGDVTAEQVKPLAEKYYGAIPMRPVPARVRVAEPPHYAAVRLEMKSTRIAQPTWSRQYLAPSYAFGETKHAYALQVLADVLGGGSTSLLYRHLVLDKQVALDAGTFYSPGPLQMSTFGFYATPRPGVAVADLEKAIEEEIRTLLRDGVEADAVQRSKSRMVAEAVYSRDSLSGPANLFGAALVTGRTVDDVENWPSRIGDVTLDQANDALRFVINDKTAVTGVLLPEPTS
ncbi:MAG TPA: pitrilysin family protein [Stellaceae bacterium]